MTRSKITKVLIGVLLIVLGVLFLVEATGVFDFEVNLFFKGWWAVLCMLIFLISMINDGANFGNILCFSIFLVLFLKAQDIIPENFNLWLLLFAVIVVFIGAKLVFGAFKKSGKQVTSTSDNASFSQSETHASDEVNHMHTEYLFTSEYIRFAGVNVGNVSFEVNFSSVTLDFTGAVFTENSSVSVSNNFGVTRIVLPATMKAEVMRDGAFGSIKDMTSGSLRVRMQLNCSFGEISIKNE